MANENLNRDTERYTKNSEHYSDPTPAKVLNTEDVMEKKAYHLYLTMLNTARLAGFSVQGSISMRDRNGRVYDGRTVKEKYDK